MVKKTPDIVTAGIGCDCGTMNIISARRTATGVETKRMRDAFLDLPATAKRMLRLAATSYVDKGDDVLILGDAAMEMANVFGRDVRRPLQAGLIAAGDLDSLEVLGLLIQGVLGQPSVPGEACYFSVPAAPLDMPGKDVIYHQGVLSRIVADCGYTPYPANESMALIFAETASDGFSGLAISYGSGMSNVSLAIHAVEGLSFSVARGGDWIDAGASSAVGSTKARMCAIKEAGMDLTKPLGREQEALAFYYKNLIEYTLDQIAAKFKSIQGQFSLPKAIPLVVSGGTSLAGGFMPFFNQVFETKRKRFPIEVSEVRHASDPMNAVAYGLLIQAGQEHEPLDA